MTLIRIEPVLQIAIRPVLLTVYLIPSRVSDAGGVRVHRVDGRDSHLHFRDGLCPPRLVTGQSMRMTYVTSANIFNHHLHLLGFGLHFLSRLWSMNARYSEFTINVPLTPPPIRR